VVGKFVKETVIKADWSGVKSKKSKTAKVVDGHCPARDWQKDAFKLLKDERYMILNAPTGSGKSWEMCLLSAHKMELDKKLRTIITVPQTIIGNGFLDAHIILPDNRKKIHWKPKYNLCGDQTASTVESLIGFLRSKASKSSDVSERALVCTHATLLLAYRSLAASNELRLLDDVVVWIDEAHHVKNVDMANIEDEAISNGIGELTKHLLDESKKNVHVGLATASFFRGDRCTLLTDAMTERFVRFNLPYDVYLSGMEHLKSFSFSFVMGDSDYMRSIEKLLPTHVVGRKSIIHFPHPMHRHARGDKHQDVADFKTMLKRFGGEGEVETSDGVTIIGDEGSAYKCLDLVDATNRDAKKTFTQAINDDRAALDAILAISMFKEGANWVFADQAIIVGHRDSLVDVVQMVGRLFRDCPGKEHVDVVMVLPWSLDQSDREKFRENLNDYLKAVYALMILEDVLTPPKIRDPKSKRRGAESGGFRVQRFQELVPDENKRIALLREGGMTMAQMIDESEVMPSSEEFIEGVRKTMESNGVPKRKSSEVAECVYARHAIQTLKSKGYDVRDISIDLIESVNPVEHLVDFINRNCGPATFRDFRLAMSEDGTLPMPWHIQKRLANEAFLRGEVEESLEDGMRHARECNERFVFAGGAA
jgi:superfamily II DNA or RNA helicase